MTLSSNGGGYSLCSWCWVMVRGTHGDRTLSVVLPITHHPSTVTLACQLGPNLLGEVVRHVLAVVRRTMDVVEVPTVRDLLLEALPQGAGIRDLGECQLHRVGCRRGHGQHERGIRRGGRTDHERGRATHMGQRHPAKCRALPQRRGREVDGA